MGISGVGSAFWRALLLHILLGGLLFLNFAYVPSQRKIPTLTDEIVSATIIDQAQLEQEINQLKAAEARDHEAKLQRETAELEAIKKKQAKELAAIKRQREQAQEALKKEQQQSLAALKAKQEKETKRLAEIKRQQKLAEEKAAKKLTEIKRQQKLAEEKAAQELAEIKQQQKLTEEKAAQELKKRKEKQTLLDNIAREEQKNAAAEEREKRAAAEQERQQEAARVKASEEQKLLQKIMRDIKVAIQNNFVTTGLPPGLSCRLRVTIIPGGEVTQVVVDKSSGHDIFDRRAVIAVEKSSPLPVPSEQLVFDRLKLRVIHFPFQP